MEAPIAAVRLSTALGLLGVSALHVAWGLGSSFPLASREELADVVIGGPTVPSSSACIAVAAAVGTGSAFMVDPVPIPRSVRRAGLLGMSLVLGTRAVLGWTGHTKSISPGSNSSRFRRLDRRLYSPACAYLAAGALVAFLDTHRIGAVSVDGIPTAPPDSW
jgi:hypothetical protein